MVEDKEDIEFEKAIGQFQLALNRVMNPLRLYGQEHYVGTAIPEIISLAVQLHWRLSGIDQPFVINEEKLHW